MPDPDLLQVPFNDDITHKRYNAGNQQKDIKLYRMRYMPFAHFNKIQYQHMKEIHAETNYAKETHKRDLKEFFQDADVAIFYCH
jgi:hypothetical protein